MAGETLERDVLGIELKSCEKLDVEGTKLGSRASHV